MKNSKWIWCAQNDLHDYNQTVLFTKEFGVNSCAGTMLRITADSWYRASINGKWINDGPARAYPNHWQYDEIDISSALKKGKNRIEIVVRYFGIGTIHQIPQQAGLRAELHLDSTVIGTDSTWLATPSRSWQQWTPKISLPMEPVEEYDARLEKILDWQPAVKVRHPGKITPRNTGLLTKTPRRFKQLHSATIVRKTTPLWCIPVTQLANPGIIEANHRISRPVVLGSILTVRKKQQFNFASEDWKVSVNGRLLKTGKVTLSVGQHTVLFFCAAFFSHIKDVVFPFRNLHEAIWGTWNVCILENFLFQDTDIFWIAFENKDVQTLKQRYLSEIEKLSDVWKSASEQFPTIGKRLDVPEEQIFMRDFAAEFAARQPLQSANSLITGQIIKPSAKGDVELCYDFGEETCGYFDFSIKADDGVIVDLNAVEYITLDGTIQHTLPFNRNGMRYTTKKGLNRFTSLKRRGGRYLFVTLRNQKAPVEIKSLRIIESTAPVKLVGSFQCSDPMLNKVWKISERTLQLCMEDTFTDCPLYEQTLWTGDARNEALYAFTAYGNTDVSARSLELGAQSLEHFPIVGCQIPSSWECLLPAWSFLWVKHVWEHFFYSGNCSFLKKIWPSVLKNIDGAFDCLDERGLFSGTFWNLFEWAPIDDGHPVVLHNSLLLAGALEAAENCTETLHDESSLKKLRMRRKKLISAVNKWWDENKQSYPDAVLENGKPSPKTCQHTSMLAVIFNVLPGKYLETALRNLLTPPESMTQVGSPFAMQFMYEALEKFGQYDAILGSIRKDYSPMLDAGATTVWETFAGSTNPSKGFPTRSHCHAWSSSPIYFLNRIVLGIRQTEPGGKSFEISPWICGLRYAHGATASSNGPVTVDWEIKDDTLHITITAPKGVKTTFVPNSSHKNRQVKIMRSTGIR